MNDWTRLEYRRLRNKGWTAQAALRAARIDDAWTDLVNEGVVRIENPYDPEPYDDSYIDTWDDLSPAKRERAKRELHATIERHGVYGIVGEFFDGEHWVQVDSVWGIFGNDLADNGYDVDIKQATIDAYRAHRDHVATLAAAELAERATLAGPSNADAVLAHYLAPELLS
jgi:hypothetical protein